PRKKYRLLVYLLKRRAKMRDKQGLVFVRTKQRANRLRDNLVRDGFKAEAIHSDKSPSFRTQAIEKFRNKEIQVMVATDVLARGIDIEDLPFVVNFDIPAQPEDYVHRVGRTGRAGKEGTSVSFVSVMPQIINVGHRNVEINEV